MRVLFSMPPPTALLSFMHMISPYTLYPTYSIPTHIAPVQIRAKYIFTFFPQLMQHLDIISVSKHSLVFLKSLCQKDKPRCACYSRTLQMWRNNVTRYLLWTNAIRYSNVSLSEDALTFRCSHFLTKLSRGRQCVSLQYVRRRSLFTSWGMTVYMKLEWDSPIGLPITDRCASNAEVTPSLVNQRCSSSNFHNISPESLKVKCYNIRFPSDIGRIDLVWTKKTIISSEHPWNFITCNVTSGIHVMLLFPDIHTRLVLSLSAN